MISTSGACPEPEVLDRLLTGTLSAVQERDLDAHLLACPGCRRHLDAQTRLDWKLNLAWADPDPASSDPGRPRSEHGPVTGPGSRIAGYECLERLGGGASGEVYRAVDRRLGRVVALKLPRFGPDPGAVERERFRREGQVLARLNDPGLVTVYEVGESDGVPYLAMEYVEGPTLSRATLGQPQPVGRSAWVCERLARALQQAHEAGLVHRDLKPANVLLQRSGGAADQGSRNGVGSEPPSGPTGSLWGTPRIIDFGLAKDLRSVDDLTLERDILGTPGYMAPEQARGRHGEVGPATDVYGLGAILYELLTGRPPYREADPLQTLLAVSFGEPVSIDRLRGGVPRDLVTICAKCLEKEPRRRYGSALDLAEDLRRFREGYPITARPPGAWGRTVRWVRREPARAGLIGLGTLVVATLAVGGPLVAVREAARVRQLKQLTAEARTEELRAREHLDLARRVVSRVSELLIEDQDVSNLPFGELEQKLQAEANQFQAQFAQLRSDDPRIELDRVEGLVRLASSQERPMAEPLIVQALAGFDALERAGQLPTTQRYYRVLALRQQATYRHLDGDHAAGQALDARARDEIQALCLADPTNHDWFFLKVRMEVQQAGPGVERARLEPLAAECRERMRAGGPSVPLQQSLANILAALGMTARAGGDVDQAIAWLGEARELAADLVRQNPKDRQAANWYGLWSVATADILETAGRFPEAVAACEWIVDRDQPELRSRIRLIDASMAQQLVMKANSLHLQLGDPLRLEQFCRRALPFAEGDAALWWLQACRAPALVRLGRLDAGVGLAEDVMAQPNLPPIWVPPLAETLALAAAQLRQPGPDRPDPDPAHAEHCAALAVRWLDLALTRTPAAGRPALLARIAACDLTALHDRDDFRALCRTHDLPLP